MLKSIAVVLGAYLLSIVLVLATNPLLSAIFPGDFANGHMPSNPALMASTGFFVVISFLCAFICARFSPASASRHIFWFFVLGEVMGAAAVIANWGKGWPHWYLLSWLVAWPISCWLGLLASGRRTGAAA